MKSIANKNIKIRKNLLGILIIVLFYGAILRGQNLNTEVPDPDPDVWWAFNEKDDGIGLVKEYKKPTQVNGFPSLNTNYTTDRFGIEKNAIAFSNNGYVSIPRNNNHNDQTFFGLGYVPKNVTITCWLKISNTRSGKLSIFSGDDKFGLFKEDNTLVIRRNTGWSSSKKPWNYSLVEFTNLMKKSGWYYVALVYGEYYFRVFVGSKEDENLICSFNFMGSYMQNWQNIQEYIIGNKTGAVVEAIDDFKVWGENLSPEAIDFNFQNEKKNAQQLLPNLENIELNPGTYYLLNEEGQCFSISGNKQAWKSYKDSYNNINWSICNQVVLTRESNEQNSNNYNNIALHLKNDKFYLTINKDENLMPVLFREREFYTYPLKISDEKEILKSYKIGQTEDQNMILAFTKNNIGSFSYQLIDVQNVQSVATSGASSVVAHSANHKHIIQSLIGVGIGVGVVAGAAGIGVGVYSLTKKASVLRAIGRGYSKISNIETEEIELKEKCE